MSAARYLAGIELRRRWRAAVVLAVVAGVAGAVVLASVAAARRGPDALDRFLAHHRLADGLVFTFDGPGDLAVVRDSLAADPDVARADAGAFVLAAFVDPEGRVGIDAVGGVVHPYGDPEVERPLVLEGRLPHGDAPFELAVNEAFAADRGVAVGDELRLAVLAADQIDRVGDAAITPAHGIETFTVVGVTRVPGDLVFENQAQPGTVFASEAEEVTWSPAFWARYDGDIAGYGAAVLLQVRSGGDLDAVLERISERFPDRVAGEDSADSLRELAQVEQSVDQQANGLAAFAAVLGLTVLVLLVQAVRRQLAGGLLGDPVLAALGPTAADRRWAATLWAGPIAAGGAVTAVLLAAAASTTGPIGIARRAELDAGFRLDPPVLLVGGGLLAAVVLLAAAVPRRSDRAPAPERTARFAQLGRGVVVLGARALLARLGGARSGTRASLLALPFAIAAITASTVFGASLVHATTAPEAYGWSWDLSAGNCSQPACAEAAARFLDDSPDVTAWTGLSIGAATIDGIDGEVELDEVEVGEGWAAGRLLDGRLLASADEALLGPATAAAAGVGIGDEIDVAVEGDVVARFTVVGLVEPPALFLDDQALDEGIVLRRDGVLRAVPPDLVDAYREEVASQYFLVDVADGVPIATATQRLQAGFPGSVLGPFRPDRLEAAYQLRRLPVLLAAVVGLLVSLRSSTSPSPGCWPGTTPSRRSPPSGAPGRSAGASGQLRC